MHLLYIHTRQIALFPNQFQMQGVCPTHNYVFLGEKIIFRVIQSLRFLLCCPISQKRKLQQKEVICHREVFVGKIIPPPPFVVLIQSSMKKDSVVLEGVKGGKIWIEFHRIFRQ